MNYRSLKKNILQTYKNSFSTFIQNLNPNYVTGFCDGESCFSVYISSNAKLKGGWKVGLVFSIHLNKRDIELLKKIQIFFKSAGNIQINADDSISYVVTSIKDISNHIIPHFEKYPLLTQKQADFELFKKVVELMKNKEHLTEEGLQKIICIKAAINLGLPEKLKIAFPEIIPASRAQVKLPENIDKHWLAGFVDAEGSFIVSIYKSKTKIGYAIKLTFCISQNNRDHLLFSSLVKHLNCGRVSVNSTNSAVEFVVGSFNEINEIIIPLFKEYNLIGIKQKDFEDFCKIVLLMKNKEHLTEEGLEEIRKIHSGMNKRRVI